MGRGSPLTLQECPGGQAVTPLDTAYAAGRADAMAGRPRHLRQAGELLILCQSYNCGWRSERGRMRRFRLHAQLELDLTDPRPTIGGADLSSRKRAIPSHPGRPAANGSDSASTDRSGARLDISHGSDPAVVP